MTITETHYPANVLAGNVCRPKHSPDTSEQIQGDFVVLRKQSSSRGFRLNSSAFEIWQLCDGERDVDSLFRILQNKYGIADGDLSTEVLMILDRLVQSGHLEAPDLLQVTEPERSFNFCDITFYVINLKEDVARREHITGQLASFGYKYQLIEGIRQGTKLHGIAQSHIKILRMPELKVPFAILEDDSCFVDGFPEQITLPGNADAYYPGLSRFGIKTPGELSRAAWDNIRYVRYADNLYRVFNMLATHAVVYLSEDFRQAALQSMVNGIEVRGMEFPGDSYYAMLQASHRVFAPNQPICYQAEHLGGVEFATRKPLCDESGS